MQAAREMLKKYGDRIWGKYGFSSGFTADGKWWSESYHGISAGLILLMIEKLPYRPCVEVRNLQ